MKKNKNFLFYDDEKYWPVFFIPEVLTILKNKTYVGICKMLTDFNLE